jgi:hypothetical protein
MGRNARAKAAPGRSAPQQCSRRAHARLAHRLPQKVIAFKVPNDVVSKEEGRFFTYWCVARLKAQRLAVRRLPLPRAYRAARERRAPTERCHQLVWRRPPARAPPHWALPLLSTPHTHPISQPPQGPGQPHLLAAAALQAAPTAARRHAAAARRVAAAAAARHGYGYGPSAAAHDAAAAAAGHGHGHAAAAADGDDDGGRPAAAAHGLHAAPAAAVRNRRQTSILVGWLARSSFTECNAFAMSHGRAGAGPSPWATRRDVP